LKKYFATYRSIAKLAFPLFLGQLGNIAVGFADNIMVGHYSTEALASASFVNNFFNIAIFACVGFTYGLTPIIGAMYARGETDRIGRAVRVGIWVNTLFTIAVASIMLGIYFNLHRLGQPDELMPLIRPYYLIVLSGMLPVCIFNVLAQWSFGCNDTALPTWIVLAANAVNIFGNYLLIYGNWGLPELGLTGAGISTLTARFICMGAILWVFFGTRRGAPYIAGFRAKADRSDGMFRSVAATGFPVSMQMTFETASFSGSAIMAGWIGAVSLVFFVLLGKNLSRESVKPAFFLIKPPSSFSNNFLSQGTPASRAFCPFPFVLSPDSPSCVRIPHLFHIHNCRLSLIFPRFTSYISHITLIH